MVVVKDYGTSWSLDSDDDRVDVPRDYFSAEIVLLAMVEPNMMARELLYFHLLGLINYC